MAAFLNHSEGEGATSFVNNNMLALFIGGFVAVAIAYAIAFRQSKVRLRLDRASIIGVAIAGAITVAGVIWYVTFRAAFLEHAHLTAAALLIIAIGIVVLINSFTAKLQRYRRSYAAIAGFMVIAAVGVGFVWLRDREWAYVVLWIEILEIIPFAVFWTAQTLEHWNVGVDPAAPNG